MPVILQFLLSLVVLVPLTIGLVRYRVVENCYHPLVFICLAGLLAECASYISKSAKGLVHPGPANVYILLAGMLWLWQFQQWRLFAYRKQVLFVLLVFYPAFWLVDMFYLESINITAKWCRIVFSFLQVFMCVTIINRLIVQERKNMLTNATFLVCAALMAHSTYKILIEVFYSYSGSDPTESTKQFMRAIANIYRYINIATYLIFALALLWAPRKKNFTLPF